MTDVIELELVEETPIDIDVDYTGEYVSGATGEEYERGYTEGYTKGEKDGIVKGKEQGYKEGYEQGVEDTKPLDLFPYMVGSPSFENADLTEITEDITIHMENAVGIGNMCSGTIFGCKKLTVYISNKCANLFRSIRLGGTNDNLEEIEIIGDTSKVTTYRQAFHGRRKLKRVLGNFDFSSIGNSTDMSEMFTSVTTLEEFYPVKNTMKFSISFSSCPNLIPESVQAIINGLADLTGGTTQTLDFHSDIIPKLTDEQITQIYNKNWTVI